MTSPVNVGIIGLGRSGWNIHAATLRMLPDHYRVAAVADPLAARRQESEQTLGCRSYATVTELLADAEVELVVVASPSYMHSAHAIAALEAGKAVVCEKPMAPRLADADSMIAAAERTGSLLTVFQNRRYDPSYLKIREVIAAGKLGRVVEIKLSSHRFGRRWDWQTIGGFAGGQLRNNGVHYLDQAIQLMGNDRPEVFHHLERTLALGDAEDYVKIILRAPGSPLADVEISSVGAYPQDMWLILGTQGTLAGDDDHLHWKYCLPAELPQLTLSTEPTPDRSYNRDKVNFVEEAWDASPANTPARSAYYLDLFRTVREGAALPVTPESVRPVMRVVEQCLAGV